MDTLYFSLSWQQSSWTKRGIREEQKYNNENPTILLFIDALFQEYYDWTYASYPAPYHLGNGEVEDFSLKGIRKRIQQCVEFHNKGKDLQPADEKYAIFKAIFQVKILPFNLF